MDDSDVEILSSPPPGTLLINIDDEGDDGDDGIPLQQVARQRVADQRQADGPNLPSLDELFQLEFGTRRSFHGPRERLRHRRRHREQRSPTQHSRRRSRSPPQHFHPPGDVVIDLTADADSPPNAAPPASSAPPGLVPPMQAPRRPHRLVRIIYSPNGREAHQNRNHQQQGQSQPRHHAMQLPEDERGGDIAMINQVIDLTADDSADEAPAGAQEARHSRRHDLNHRPGLAALARQMNERDLSIDQQRRDAEAAAILRPHGQGLGLHLQRRQRQFHDIFANFDQIIGLTRQDYDVLGPILRDPIWNQIHLDYAANGVDVPPEPDKPPYVPRSDPPPGFSNGTGEDVTAICPSCGDELIHDPDHVAPSPTGKRPRNKKDRADNQIMAVKDCGHVFCRSCFDNRRALVKRADSGFRSGHGKNSVLCAVDECTSDVSQKNAWVGLFL